MKRSRRLTPILILTHASSKKRFGEISVAYTGDPYEVITELNSLGEKEVRNRVLTRYFGDPGSLTRTVVEGWLSRKESSAALRTAKRANIIALIALITSIILALAEII